MLLLILVVVALVAGNNLSVCVGPAIGSRALSWRLGILIGALGFALGLLAQGGNMASTVNAVLPGAPDAFRVEALLITALLFSVAYFLRAPFSLTMSLVGLFAGRSVAQQNGIGQPLIWVAAAWGISPAVAAVAAFALLKLTRAVALKNFWNHLRLLKALLITLSFTASFALGANTIGLLVAVGGFNTSALLCGILGIAVGSAFLSSGSVRRISQELFLMRYQNAVVALLTSTILVQTATLFGLPISSAGILSFAVLGAGLSYREKLMSLKPFLANVFGWVLAPLLGFLIGLLIT